MVSQPNVEFVLRALDGDVAKAMRDLVINTTAALQEETPVDTGFARANWVPNIGQPYRGEPSTTGAAASAQQAGLAQVAGLTSADRPAYISNNTAYIQRLNEGHSPQAPPGFIEAIVEREVNALSGS